MQCPVIGCGRKRHPPGFLDIGGDQCPILGEGADDTQRFIAPRRSEIIGRLKHAKEHQANAHARGKKHGEPTDVAIIGFRIRTAEPNGSHRCHDEQQAKQDENVCRRQEEPVKGAGQRRTQPAKKCSGLLRCEERVNDEGDDAKPRNRKNRVVNVELKRADAGFYVVLTDLVFGIDDLGRPVRSGYPLVCGVVLQFTTSP